MTQCRCTPRRRPVPDLSLPAPGIGRHSLHQSVVPALMVLSPPGHEVWDGSRKGIIMNSTRIAFSVLGVAGLGLAALGTAPAQAASPADRGPNDLCKVRVLSVQADDLQEDVQEQDEVFLRLGDSRTVERPYFLGQHRNTLGDGQDFFNGHERVALIENDAASGNKDVIDRARLSCDTGQVESTLSDANADTVYTVVWRVDEIS